MRKKNTNNTKGQRSDNKNIFSKRTKNGLSILYASFADVIHHPKNPFLLARRSNFSITFVFFAGSNKSTKLSTLIT